MAWVIFVFTLKTALLFNALINSLIHDILESKVNALELSHKGNEPRKVEKIETSWTSKWKTTKNWTSFVRRQINVYVVCILYIWICLRYIFMISLRARISMSDHNAMNETDPDDLKSNQEKNCTIFSSDFRQSDYVISFLSHNLPYVNIQRFRDFDTMVWSNLLASRTNPIRLTLSLLISFFFRFV